MKRTIIAAALFLAFGTANATGGGNQGDDSCKGNCPQGGGTATATATATGGSVKADIKSTNVNTNVNSNKQGQLQGQMQGQLQGQSQDVSNAQSQSNSAVGSGNSTTVTVESTKQPVSGPGIASSPSATCRIAVGLSVGGTFGSVGGFGSVEDENCTRNEKVRMLKEVLARPDAAKRLACEDAAMAKALGDCDSVKKSEAVTVVGAYSPVKYPTDCVADQYIARRQGSKVCK